MCVNTHVQIKSNEMVLISLRLASKQRTHTHTETTSLQHTESSVCVGH